MAEFNLESAMPAEKVQPAAEPIATIGRAAEPAVSETPAVRSERASSSWDMLANDLGIEIPPEPESESSVETTAAQTVPVVERAEAERIFESLFTAAGPAEKVAEPIVPAREERPAARHEEPRFASRREEPRREESRHGRGDREEKPRRGRREDESRRGARPEEPRRGDREEPSWRKSKSEPDELFIDEDLEADEELEVGFEPAEETAESDEKKKRRRRRRGRKDREKEPGASQTGKAGHRQGEGTGGRRRRKR